jgi:branched-chain amino acid transport system substrate-binding protein
MSRVVILKIGDGSFETGFSVTLEIRDNNRLIAPFAEGKLVPNLDIADALQNYRRAYYHWVKSQPSLGITVPHSMITHAAVGDPRDKLRQATQTLKDSLNEWLNSSYLSSIQNHILFHIGTESEVRFLSKLPTLIYNKFPGSVGIFYTNGVPMWKLLLLSREIPR